MRSFSLRKLACRGVSSFLYVSSQRASASNTRGGSGSMFDQEDWDPSQACFTVCDVRMCPRAASAFFGLDWATFNGLLDDVHRMPADERHTLTLPDPNEDVNEENPLRIRRTPIIRSSLKFSDVSSNFRFLAVSQLALSGGRRCLPCGFKSCQT